MFYAWAGLGVLSDALLIQLRSKLSLDSTPLWIDAVIEFRHGLASSRWFFFYIGLVNTMIGILILWITPGKNHNQTLHPTPFGRG